MFATLLLCAMSMAVTVLVVVLLSFLHSSCCKRMPPILLPRQHRTLNELCSTWESAYANLQSTWWQGQISAAVLEVDHLLDRLNCGLSQRKSARFQVGQNLLSGFWAVMLAFRHLRLEFEAIKASRHEQAAGASCYTSVILRALEDEVKDAWQDVWMDGGKAGKYSYAPWTPEGQGHHHDFICFFRNKLNQTSCKHRDFLAQNPDIKKCGTVIECVETLRDAASGARDITSQQLHDLRTIIMEVVRDEEAKNSDWWTQGSLVKVFAMGLKDLFKQNDFTALIFVLRAIQNVEDSGGVRLVVNAAPHSLQTHLLGNSVSPGQVHEPAPFSFVEPFTELAGPHIAKFAGNGADIRVLLQHIDMIEHRVIPNFVARLVKLKGLMSKSASGGLQTRGTILAALMTAAQAVPAICKATKNQDVLHKELS